MKKILTPMVAASALAASALLTGCANALAVAGALGEGMADASNSPGYTQMQNAAFGALEQSKNAQVPEVMAVRQPDGTTVYYCRDLSGQIVACRKLD